jgi:hypothetical protein
MIFRTRCTAANLGFIMQVLGTPKYYRQDHAISSLPRGEPASLAAALQEP